MSQEGATGSTVARRQLGRYLRDLRSRGRFSVRASATHFEWSETKMWRIESGMTSMRSHEVKMMCEYYGAPAETTAALMALAKETRANSWWVSYSDAIPDYLDLYIGLEDAAVSLEGYWTELVPGLLQTERYARAAIEACTAPERVESQVQLRMARQVLMSRTLGPLWVKIVLNEAVLHRPVGGIEVMIEQLRHLVVMSQRNNVAIRVMPYSAGFHQGARTGPFIKLDFPTVANGAPSEPSTVYVEGYTGSLFLEQPHEIERYSEAFAGIWEASMSEVESVNYIAKVAREMQQQ
ncbi:helix-turn-helix domain-containing protein [Actinokineospora iranica]|uniref:Helix-turn-helix domain-containing protein n=1 Tax=Actinokineospora iranica TaxID=1271860 RepID=A0A1G6X6H8_9PSEU|nr:helix-turn-helix transcriptional regulator [Actinokineospora iranica]SDD73719.1 Helix-turn-helix domain-containing protein [Actinokineospora iranica]